MKGSQCCLFLFQNKHIKKIQFFKPYFEQNEINDVGFLKKKKKRKDTQVLESVDIKRLL